MTIQPTTAEPAAERFVAYEYATVRAPRDLESLYRDTYHGFGWIVESAEPAHPVRALPLTPAIVPNHLTLKLKRDRDLRNRELVQTLQRKAENSLTTIAGLERSKSIRAVTLAVTIGIIGAALLAGSIFALNGGLLVLSIILGAVGLIGWLAGFFTYLQVKRSRTEAVIPLIDRELDALQETGAQAARLLG